MRHATSAPISWSPARAVPAWLHRIEWDRMAAAIVAAVLLVVAMGLPMWKMTLLAPQYPGGLHMSAYGDRFEGDVREINILNHYIGMKPINADDVPELSIFRPAMIALIVTLLALAVAPIAQRLKVAESILIWLLPIGLVVDLQWWLYRYGHSLNPEAPLRLDPFTPRVFGTTKVMNFHNEASLAAGFWLLVAAAAVISLGPSLLRAIWELPRSFKGAAVGAALVLVLLGGRADRASAAPPRLADLIAAAEPGATVFVPPGVYHEHLVIDKSIVLRGGNQAVIDGDGAGDVVVVKAEDVEIRGFTIRHSGDAVSQEPAGVRLLSHHTLLAGNTIEDVYFGVSVQGGGHHEIEYNTIRPAKGTAVEWRGHAISLWNTEHNLIRENTISDAKDGLYISFSNNNYVHGNRVSDSRFGIHYMYANDNRFTANVFTRNLSGALVMYSKGLFLQGNEFSDSHGNTAYGLLLKDVDDLWAEDNRFTGNGTGITADEAPASPDSSVIFHHNLVALNRVGLALMTTTAMTFYENSMVDNGVQVSARGGSLTASLSGHESGTSGQAAAVAGASGHTGHEPAAAQPAPAPATAPASRGAEAHNRWSAEGRGNYWSDYAGYDANGDGVGDRPYRSTSAFASLRDRNPALDLFRYTPAQQAIDAGGRLFPVVPPEVLIEDTAPLMSPPTPLPKSGDGHGLLAVSAGLVLAAAWMVLNLRGRGFPRVARRPRLAQGRIIP